MYADPRGWVLLCAPKTGTTTARHVCHRLGEGTSNVGRVHLTAANWRAQWENWKRNGRVPDWDLGGASIVCTIREPESWYRSVYRYTWARYPDARQLLARWGDPTNPDEILAAWTSRGGHGGPACELTNPCPGTDAPTLYQAAMRHYYGDCAPARWVRLEHQADDLAIVLGVTAAQVRRIAPRNVTPADAAPWCDRVDPETVRADVEFWRECLTRTGQAP